MPDNVNKLSVKALDPVQACISAINAQLVRNPNYAEVTSNSRDVAAYAARAFYENGYSVVVNEQAYFDAKKYVISVSLTSEFEVNPKLDNDLYDVIQEGE